MYKHTFTEGKVRMGWKIKVLVQGIWSKVFVQGIGQRYVV